MKNKRLTTKFGDKVILPMIPMEIKSKEDLSKYHQVRREYEENTIRLSEYEDIGSVEEIINLKENNRLLENGSKQLCSEIKLLIKDKDSIIANHVKYVDLVDELLSIIDDADLVNRVEKIKNASNEFDEQFIYH